MSTVEQAQSFVSLHIDDEDGFVPFQHPSEDAPDGGLVTFGEFKPLRVGGSGGQTLIAGIWRAHGPGVSPTYDSPDGDETFLVLEGECTITELDTGATHRYGPGDVVSWSQGTRTRWEIHSPFRKLVVVGSGRPQR
ncbi:MAG TPA: cupin domain-containing protein [Pseudonocardia sp.]|nr:cupin domain-containing protein [Pseudonocardia sp.]